MSDEGEQVPPARSGRTRAKVEALELEGLTITVDVGRLSIAELSVPLELSGVVASSAELEEIGAAGVEVGDAADE